MGNNNHISYIFIPFSMENSDRFQDLINAVSGSGKWDPVQDDIRYMLKYVSDKYVGEDNQNRLFYHYTLRDDSRQAFHIPAAGEWFRTVCKWPVNNAKEYIRFQLHNVHLFCFGTRMCILAYQIALEKTDPLDVADSLFQLKQADLEVKQVMPPVAEGETPSPAPKTTALRLARDLMREFEAIDQLTFFRHMDARHARANVLTYLEVPNQESYDRELFYLRNCYNRRFLYTGNSDPDRKEIFQNTADILWGVTSEASVCLACPEKGNEKFIRKTFLRNFQSEYLFMHVVLLHQKYVLYMLLTELGIGENNDRETLEKYQENLSEFKADFVFSVITEVPQYQDLYDYMVRASALEQLYQDVQEPLISLGEIRRKAEEKEQAKRDSNINHALVLLSVLSFFSVMADSIGFVDSLFAMLLPSVNAMYAKLGCMGLILLLFIYIFIKLLSKPRKKCKKAKASKKKAK